MESQDQARDPHFLALMQQLASQFKPAASYEAAGLQLTTGQVFERLQTHYPSPTYSPADVYRALEQAGFVQADPFPRHALRLALSVAGKAASKTPRHEASPRAGALLCGLVG